jgi:hypothetical protein
MKSPGWLSESGQNEGRVVEAGAGDFHIVSAQNDLFFAEMAFSLQLFPSVQYPEKLHSWWTSSRKKANPLALNAVGIGSPAKPGCCVRPT